MTEHKEQEQTAKGQKHTGKTTEEILKHQPVNSAEQEQLNQGVNPLRSNPDNDEPKTQHSGAGGSR